MKLSCGRYGQAARVFFVETAPSKSLQAVIASRLSTTEDTVDPGQLTLYLVKSPHVFEASSKTVLHSEVATGYRSTGHQ